MIGSLRGKLTSRKPELVLVEVNGVGYQVSVPLSVLTELPAEGREVFLHIYTHVREDALQLFGFAAEKEKQVFTTLLGISGIGPKMALNILSGMSYDRLIEAIEREDIELICNIPGLGKKTAHRLVLEMRGKLPAASAIRDSVFEDALSALVNLGYKKPVAHQYLEFVYKEGQRDIELLLKETLKRLVPQDKSAR